jgi:hypothetical protein
MHFSHIDRTASEIVPLFEERPQQFTPAAPIAQGIDDDGSIQQNRHPRLGRKRRRDALSASRRIFRTQAAAPPAFSMSGWSAGFHAGASLARIASKRRRRTSRAATSARNALLFLWPTSPSISATSVSGSTTWVL